MKNFLVVGGAGYIGSVLVNYLIDLGYKVVVIDNLSTGHKFLINKKAIFFRLDINNFGKLNTFFKKFYFDAVFHFAAATSVKESEKKPLKYYRINVDGTQNLLNCICKKKIKYFIFSSTCAVYGNSKKEKVNELDSTIPISNYAKSKLLSEILIKNYAKKFKFKYAILRYFNVVGADSKLRSGQVYKGPLVKNIAKNISNKNYSIKLFGSNYNTKDGTTIRDYIDVNDLSELHILSLKKLFRFKSFTLNCGYNIGYSVIEIIQKFESLANKKIFINYFPRIKSDVTKIYSNNKFLKFLFPLWKRKFGIADSIRSALAWENILKKKLIKKN
jgi:UDP-glucose 4-epimerase